MSDKAARLGDAHSRGGTIVEASPDVYVNGKRVARVGDAIICPFHGRNKIMSGSSKVFANSKAVAHVGSKCECGATIIQGSEDFFV
jgi:uncharacterized Zn-binding protein involved in type VI secretion